MASAVAPPGSVPAGVNPLAFFRDTETFKHLKLVVQQNPDKLTTMLQKIGRTDFQLLQIISQNTDELIRMILINDDEETSNVDEDAIHSEGPVAVKENAAPKRSRRKKMKCYRISCLKQGKHRCSRCKQVVFCSQECSDQHWPVHKEECRMIREARKMVEEVQVHFTEKYVQPSQTRRWSRLKPNCNGCRQKTNKKLGNNRGIPKTQLGFR
jgi:hypothetical protein